MRERLKRDKAKTHVLPISALGLMEMTRQRAQESLSDSIYENCPYCQGRGVVKTSMTTSVELHRTLNTVMRKYQEEVHEFRVILNPDVLKRLKEEDEELLIELERRYASQSHVPRRSDFSPREVCHHRREQWRGIESINRAPFWHIRCCDAYIIDNNPIPVSGFGKEN